MPFPRPTLTALRQQAMRDITTSDLPNADGFLRRSVLRVLAWVQAGLAYLHYAFLDWISRMAVPFTAEAEFLEAWAAAAPTPVLRQAAAPATGTGTWSGITGTVLPAGSICTSGNGTQYATNADAVIAGGGSLSVAVTAGSPGAAGNADSGAALTLASIFAGINSAGYAVGPMTGGTDVELDRSLRSRMLESYAAPPHGGSAADYVTWALEVPGVTRAWVPPVPAVPGSVTVWFMMDAAEIAHGGFPQGTNGVAALETRDTAAAGDQLAVANFIFPLRPVTAIVYAAAPTASPLAFTFTGLSGISAGQKTQVSAALAGLLLASATPLGAPGFEQSDVISAVAAIGGLPAFAVTVPPSWPAVAAAGSLFTLGTVTYA